MPQHGWVHQSLMVNMLVFLCALGLAVKNQAAAKEVGLKHFNFLVGSFAGIENLPHLKHSRQVRADSL